MRTVPVTGCLSRHADNCDECILCVKITLGNHWSVRALTHLDGLLSAHCPRGCCFWGLGQEQRAGVRACHFRQHYYDMLLCLIFQLFLVISLTYDFQATLMMWLSIHFSLYTKAFSPEKKYFEIFS